LKKVKGEEKKKKRTGNRGCNTSAGEKKRPAGKFGKPKKKKAPSFTSNEKS